MMHNSIKLCALNISEIITSDIFYSLNNKASLITGEKINRYRLKKDKKRTLYGELLIRYMIMKTQHVANKEIEIAIGQSGKPYCKSHPNIYFNISHSGEWVVCVMCDNQVGADIEKIGKVNWKIAERFFTEREQKRLFLSTDNREELFYKLWTLKESYMKYTGKGMVISLHSFDCDFVFDKISLYHSLNNQMHFFSFRIFNNYYLSICCEKKYEKIYFERVTINQLLEYI